MTKKKYAFFLMGKVFQPETHYAAFETDDQISYVYTVRNLSEALEKAKDCKAAGFGAIELCGAFGASGAKQIMEATNNEIAVGYVVHEPEQDPLFNAFFA